ncbi:MAG: hypothetical protein QOK60_08005 [Nitrososphaeraceae archaeon]|nr:hypothetical protein [Nitrososphaeraceae archaeon]MDW0146692.1 hypothetical protein [Nitrososphaeraceae archaeon]
MPELSRNCMDMTNSSSTYLGIIAGAIIGGIISWWIFNRQKKTSDKQDYTLNRIEQLENYNEKLLEKIKVLEEKNEKLLEKIFDLNKKIDSLLEGH